MYTSTSTDRVLPYYDEIVASGSDTFSTVCEHLDSQEEESYEVAEELLRWLADLWITDAQALILLMAKLAFPDLSVRELESIVGLKRTAMSAKMRKMEKANPDLKRVLHGTHTMGHVSQAKRRAKLSAV